MVLSVPLQVCKWSWSRYYVRWPHCCKSDCSCCSPLSSSPSSVSSSTRALFIRPVITTAARSRTSARSRHLGEFLALESESIPSFTRRLSSPVRNTNWENWNRFSTFSLRLTFRLKNEKWNGQKAAQIIVRFRIRFQLGSCPDQVSLSYFRCWWIEAGGGDRNIRNTEGNS